MFYWSNKQKCQLLQKEIVSLWLSGESRLIEFQREYQILHEKKKYHDYYAY